MNAATLINQDSGTVEWFTPWNIIDAARATMGGRIWLDPASCEQANEKIMAYEFRPLLAYPQCFLHGRTNYND